MISESARPSSATAPPNASTVAADAATIRRVETLVEYHQCVAIQEEVWGNAFLERVPATILMVAQKLDGVCAAAFAPGGRVLGFVFGLTGFKDGRLAHWSDMLAVRTEARGAHLGERLKHYQRDLVRAVGVETMYWTFDPLVARNAHLNLNRLGARAVEYVPNMYGSDTGSPLHGALATDRLVAAWDLTSPGESPNGVGRSAAHLESSAAVLVNPTAPDGRPELSDFMLDVPHVHIAVPHDFDAEPPERRALWRAVTRDAFRNYLGAGYEVTGFRRSDNGELPYYELVPRDGASR